MGFNILVPYIVKDKIMRKTVDLTEVMKAAMGAAPS